MDFSICEWATVSTSTTVSLSVAVREPSRKGLKGSVICNRCHRGMYKLVCDCGKAPAMLNYVLRVEFIDTSEHLTVYHLIIPEQ